MIPPAQVGLEMVVHAWQENKKVQAIEKTKRLAITERSKVELERIRSQRVIMEKYLSGMFAERKQIISGLFDALDQGMESNNDSVIQQSLAGIVDIAKECPLKGLQQVIADYDNPNVNRIDF